MERTCRACRCTENNACMTPAGPCHWIESNLCSAPACAVNARAITEADRPLIAQLTQAHQTVLNHTGSYEEMAAAMNCAVGTVKSRMNRARVQLTKLRAVAMETA